MKIVQRKTLGNEVLRSIRQAILSHELRAGEHLSETTLAEQFGTSRGPIREALQILIREGFAKREINGRVIVLGFTDKDFTDLYETRLLLESHAIQKWQTENESTYEILLEMEEILAKTKHPFLDSLEFTNLDMKFHGMIVSLSEDKFLIQSWNGLRDILEAILYFTNQTSRRNSVNDIHLSILTALKNRDRSTAVSLLKNHFDTAGHIMKSAIQTIRKA